MMSHRIDYLITQMSVVGGAEVFLREIAPRMMKSGWEIRVISIMSGGVLLDELKRENVPVIELDLSGKTDLRAVRKLIRLWKTNPPDLIHTYLYHAGIVGRVVAHLMHLCPVIVHQTGPEFSRSKFRSWLDRITSPWVNHYISPCQAVTQILQSREGIPAKKIRTISTGIPIPEKFSTEKPSDWTVPPGMLSIVCVARLSPEKGQFRLLTAIKQLEKNPPPFHTVFIGDGPLREKLHQYTVELGIQDRVSFIGTRRDIFQWLPHFDLFVLPSDWEAISLALLEAMAARLTVVATAVGGTPEVVQEGKTGLLVPPHPSELASAIIYLLEHAEVRENMGKAAYQHVVEHYSIDNVIHQLSKFYSSILDKPIRNG